MSVHQKDFDLADTEQEINFLREMYNVATQITALSRDLDQLKEKSLSDIKAAADRVLSLSSTHHSSSGSTRSSTGSRHRWAGSSEDEDDLGVFKADDIQSILDQMDYEIEFIPWGVRVVIFHGIRTNRRALASSSCRNHGQDR